MKVLKYTTIFVLLSTLSLTVNSQENVWEDLLREEVEVENPVYKPVIGFGTGIMNFHGDVKNNRYNPVIGNLGYKINISTFLDNKHLFKTNFFLLYGQLSANQRSVDDLTQNLNFQTDLVSFGININYGFGHFYKNTDVFLRPFVSVGIENLQFNTKGDLYDAEGNYYHYWSDGSIRNIKEGVPGPSEIIPRDYKYESDLREMNRFGLGNYSQNTFAIPVDIGLDLLISDRITLRLGTSLHYTFTDLLDDVSSDAPLVTADQHNDMFSYSYMTFHLDLFSEAKTIIVEKLFADVEGFDYTFYGDEDGDLVFDGWDECPGTPKGVAVDSLGCPFDDDEDGVPNYRDKQKNSPPKAIVDKEGVEISDDRVFEHLAKQAVSRDEVDLYAYVNMTTTRTRRVRIPEKFKQLDTDEDNYISYEEVLQAIDRFFDFEVSLSTEDIYELTDFFFSQ
ncbi:MAG: hypothetical protein ACLFUC_07610 [Bacteroidales bacterium]